MQSGWNWVIFCLEIPSRKTRGRSCCICFSISPCAGAFWGFGHVLGQVLIGSLACIRISLCWRLDEDAMTHQGVMHDSPMTYPCFMMSGQASCFSARVSFCKALGMQRISRNWQSNSLLWLSASSSWQGCVVERALICTALDSIFGSSPTPGSIVETIFSAWDRFCQVRVMCKIDWKMLLSLCFVFVLCFVYLI